MREERRRQREEGLSPGLLPPPPAWGPPPAGAIPPQTDPRAFEGRGARAPVPGAPNGTSRDDMPPQRGWVQRSDLEGAPGTQAPPPAASDDRVPGFYGLSPEERRLLRRQLRESRLDPR
jgi:hypothetical protein